MKTIILMVSLILCHISAYSFDKQSGKNFANKDPWHLFGHSGSDDTIYLKGIQKIGSRYDFWFKAERAELSECKGNPFSKDSLDTAICEIKQPKTVKTQMSRFVIDCKTKKSMRYESIWYSYTGSVLDTEQASSKGWETIFPDSMLEGIYETLCQN